MCLIYGDTLVKFVIQLFQTLEATSHISVDEFYEEKNTFCLFRSQSDDRDRHVAHGVAGTCWKDHHAHKPRRKWKGYSICHTS